MSKNQKQLILASTSRYRRALMEQAGFAVECVAPDYDESLYVNPDPRETIAFHARGKALSVAKRFPRDIVIGSDQGLIFGNELIGKPYSIEAACAQLTRFRGHTVQIVTSLFVACQNEEKKCQNVAHLHFREDLTDDAIRHYVEADKPLDCAGAFKIEARGSRLFSAIECDDPTAIQGLPLMALNAFILAFDPSYDAF